MKMKNRELTVKIISLIITIIATFYSGWKIAISNYSIRTIANSNKYNYTDIKPQTLIITGNQFNFSALAKDVATGNMVTFTLQGEPSITVDK